MKFTIGPIVRDHVDTLVDDRRPTGLRRFASDLAMMFGLPAMLGTVVGIVQPQIADPSDIVAGVAILTGLLFAQIIFIFQLRLQVSADPRYPRDGSVLRLIDELFANVSFAVLSGLATTVLAIVAAATLGDATNTAWDRLASGALVATGANLVLTVLMCLKRLRDAYKFLSR
ncbi:hypothetical protein [Rhodococcoides fascians]|uniref:hypothetical protein n=1 Tax=Rhodococcoides fascians TaxID=1828 RepID=UPI0012D35964|nr:hypothetical protein [Rhodococcus fascians]